MKSTARGRAGDGFGIKNCEDTQGGDEGRKRWEDGSMNNTDAAEAIFSRCTLFGSFFLRAIVCLLIIELAVYHYIASALEQQQTTKEQYNFICRGLVQYQEEFPFYFQMVLL